MGAIYETNRITEEGANLMTSILTSESASSSVITVDVNLSPEDGFIPESLFDTSGKISFVLGWGNYLPGLHTLCAGKKDLDEVCNVSIDAGWGSRNKELMFNVKKEMLRKRFRKSSINIETLKVGEELNLQDGIRLAVSDILEDSIILDANPPLAGASYSCSLKILSIEPLNIDFKYPNALTTTNQNAKSGSKYQTCCWALGCFWGGELAFMRVPGVVGTKVGYTQGITTNPTYEAVSTGKTKHREAVVVVYDPAVVSYEQLLEVAMERLRDTISPSMLHTMFEEQDENTLKFQHQPGFYFHTQEQQKLATTFLEEYNNEYNQSFIDVELKAASSFHPAEDYHQQYLLKGGQSARKGCKEKIRCYG